VLRATMTGGTTLPTASIAPDARISIPYREQRSTVATARAAIMQIHTDYFVWVNLDSLTVTNALRHDN
jgi:hypothetical protein